MIRQAYIREGKYLDYNAMDKIIQPHEAHKALPAKATLVGIIVEVNEESYTSQASFLDLDEIPVYDPDNKEKHVFSGMRIRRRNRFYRAKDGRKICADVNGAYNTLRKRKPDAFAKGTAGYVVHPVRLAVTV